MSYSLRAYSKDLTLAEALADGNSFLLKTDINYLYELTEAMEITNAMDITHGTKKNLMLINSDYSKATMLPRFIETNKNTLFDYFEENSECILKTYSYEVKYMVACFDFYSGIVYAGNEEQALEIAHKEVLSQLNFVNDNFIDLDIDLDVDHINIKEVN
tara:strand:- start:181 stop:657 length:477 start_codon:yes stop_codon:yes gene_type:complete